MSQKVRWRILEILIPLVALACTGCTIGTKVQKKTLWITPRPIPQAAKGLPIVAENDPINLQVLDKPDFGQFKQKVTGYVVIDPWTAQQLIECWNEHNKP